MNQNFHSNTPARPLLCPDLVALVAFAGTAAMVSPFVSAFDPIFEQGVASLPNRIANATNLSAGVRLSTDLLAQAPKGLRRRIWVLSDGQDTVEINTLSSEVARAASHRININTIAFGFDMQANPERLKSVSAGTRTGRFVSVRDAKRLGQVLQDAPKRTEAHQGEATVFCIDVSPSMQDVIRRKSKIEIVRDTMFDLLQYKRKMWS